MLPHPPESTVAAPVPGIPMTPVLVGAGLVIEVVVALLVAVVDVAAGTAVVGVALFLLACEAASDDFLHIRCSSRWPLDYIPGTYVPLLDI